MGIVSSAFRMIEEFQGQYRFLSNFYYSPFKFRGLDVATAEHAFQALKTQKLEERLWVIDSPTPGIAKRRGRMVELRPDWEDVKLSIMLEVVHAKFMSEQLRDMLKLTGFEFLSEGNYWHDQFWGNCMCPTHVDEPGRNYLGKILMYVRKEL